MAWKKTIAQWTGPIVMATVLLALRPASAGASDFPELVKSMGAGRLAGPETGFHPEQPENCSGEEATFTPVPTITLPPHADYTKSAVRFEPGKRLHLSSLKMTDLQIGWAVSAGHVLRTTDGGASWQDVTPPESGFGKGGFFALDGQRAWAIKTVPVYLHDEPVEPAIWFGAVWRTENGGRTWTASRPFYLPGINYKKGAEEQGWFDGFEPAAMRFVDSRNGWLIAAFQQSRHAGQSYAILRTGDGGRTWQIANEYIPGCYVRGMEFRDAETGYYIYDCLDVFAAVGMGLLTTHDGGVTWEESYYPDSTPQEEWLSQRTGGNGGRQAATGFIHGVDGFLAAGFSEYDQGGVGVEGFVVLGEESGQVRSWFSGQGVALDTLGEFPTWTIWSTRATEEFYDAGHGWRLFFGVDTWVQATTDGGATWSSLIRVPWEEAILEFIDPMNGWAVEQTVPEDSTYKKSVSRLHRTSDGGRTWDTLIPEVR